MREALVKLKQPSPKLDKKGAVYAKYLVESATMFTSLRQEEH